MNGAKSQLFKIKQSLKKFFRDEKGATAIEYSLIAGGLSIVIATTVYALGATLNETYFTPVQEALEE